MFSTNSVLAKFLVYFRLRRHLARITETKATRKPVLAGDSLAVTFVILPGCYFIAAGFPGNLESQVGYFAHYLMQDRAEIGKRVERAEKLLQKGKAGDALHEYLQILREDPENDNVRQMASDLCLSVNRTKEAVTLLGELFERQVSAGDATRASLTYKKLARYGSPTLEQKLRFGQILENSNRRLAIETYENVLEDFTRQGRKQECLDVLNRIVALDPTQQNFMRLGELSSQLGDSKTAAACFLRIAGFAEASGADARPWIERAYSEGSSDPQVVLAYGKSLLAQGEIGAAIFIFEPQVQGGNASLELQESYAKALLAANRLVDAEPLVWQLFEQDPSRIHQVATLIGSMVDAEIDAEAVALARKLEQFKRRRGERRAFVLMMQDIVAAHRASPDLLEFLSELFNASNRETDYSQTVLKLFDLYYSMGNFRKAAECLDRAAEIDPYERGHQKRLETLRGKIDDNRYKVIASRFTQIQQSGPEPTRTEESTLGAGALQDLMLQVEILVQYGMRSKAIERLQRIQELFPHEEDKNEDLHQLYMAAGMTPRYAGSAPVLPPLPRSVAPTPAPAVAAPTPVQTQSEAADISSLTRVAEITRKLYQQSNANAVLSTAVNEIGGQWKATRCIAAMRKPGLPPTMVHEYCADPISAGDPASLTALLALLQDLAVSRGALTIVDALASPELRGVREMMAGLSIASLLALPLSDGVDPVGVLVLTQSQPHGWHSSDVVVLRTLSEQMVIALNNAGLRRLVKNLSMTDEKSGLLKRASYIDLLLAETRRGVQQDTPVTILLMQFGKRAAMSKEVGEEAVEAIMEQVGQLLTANIRSNDLAFRYEMTTIAIVLGDTAQEEALLTVEKLRKLVAAARLPGKDQHVPFAAGLAEAVMRQQYDPVDIVTEVINRAEQALAQAIAEGPGKAVCLAPSAAAGAVA